MASRVISHLVMYPITEICQTRLAVACTGTMGLIVWRPGNLFQRGASNQKTCMVKRPAAELELWLAEACPEFGAPLRFRMKDVARFQRREREAC